MRAYDVYVILRSLPTELKAQFLRANAAEIAGLYSAGSYLARKFPTGEFPAVLACEARKHRDYPQYDTDAQLRFIARFISGGDVATPEYALKITRNFLPDKIPSRR